MEIKKRTPDLENIFNKQWKANNYQQNGMSKILDQRKEHYNKMFNIKPKEQHRKEILEANSVEGQVKKLEEQMKAVSNIHNNNFR